MTQARDLLSPGTAAPMDVLVVTPLQAELEALLRACLEQGCDAQQTALGRLPVTRLPGLGISLACGGTGKAQFALQTQHLLDVHPGWGVVICAGTAGALSDELAIGDVVVASATVEHDYRNGFTAHPPPTFASPPAVVAGLAQALGPSVPFRVHVGVVASGDEDIMEPGRRAALRGWTGALAVAWEGAGGARACQFSGVPFVELRGISDAAGPSAPGDFERNLALAMRHVALLLMAWRGYAG